MAVKTRAQIQTDIDTIITTNGIGGITGATLNGLLEDIADSFSNIPDDIATELVAGLVELKTTAEIDAGVDNDGAMSPAQFVASKRNIRYVNWRVLNQDVDQAIAANIMGDLEWQIAGTLVSIGAYMDTAGVTGTAIIDVNKAGSTIMTTDKIEIETAEKSSRTAADQPVITDAAVAIGDVYTVDIDAIQTVTAGKGLTIRFGIRES